MNRFNYPHTTSFPHSLNMSTVYSCGAIALA